MSSKIPDDERKRLEHAIDKYRLFTPDADVKAAAKELRDISHRLNSATSEDGPGNLPLPPGIWLEIYRPPLTAVPVGPIDPTHLLWLLLTDDCEPMSADLCHLLKIGIEAAHNSMVWHQTRYERTGSQEYQDTAQSISNSLDVLFRNWVRHCCPGRNEFREMVKFLG